MRTPRVIILAAFLLATLVLSCMTFRSSAKGPAFSTKKANSPTGLRALFNFNTPLSLFPPNAIISLTDDNTTYFMARPAAFGPLLPIKGLDGQLWIGSGFGADSLRQGGIVAGAEGELGCSDVPGWVDGSKKLVLKGGHMDTLPEKKFSKLPDNSQSQKRRRSSDDAIGDRNAGFGHLRGRPDTKSPPVDDGTDDYLHHHLLESKPSKQGHNGGGGVTGFHADHADIQSIQEGAEIAGKVVLLSRGGCGFLEKVKWVQRRGGIALIVGDDTKGGPLLQMYARGDTSNVTIPSVFTSYTTAHLLSKLMPGSGSEDATDENGRSTKRKPKTTTKKSTKHTSLSNSEVLNTGSQDKGTARVKSRWFSFSRSDSKEQLKKGKQPGKKDWILVDEWNEQEDGVDGSGKASSKSSSAAKNKHKDAGNKDGFIIGEQDWRDPDLMESKPNTKTTTKGGKKLTPTQGAKASGKPSNKHSAEVKGGSITPGSGQYRNSHHRGSTGSKSEQTGEKANDKTGIVNKIFGDDEDESEVGSSANDVYLAELEREANEADEGPIHEGLWVTLTPTTGSSPFFDTLLVLVVSPLVTLTVVYALLLIRSNLRRRRWRAPKSVVERLPVRTYQTVRSVATSRLPSPRLSPAAPPTVTTPLLEDSTARQRPRSQTTSGLPEPRELLRTNSNSSQLSRAPSPRAPSRGLSEHETGVASEWKKYMGKQVECVVCLEEYVDGVSQVMSLPCGHEFHVDCITPWLTTRRRTCPICKGDVVRSLARGSPSTPRYEPYHEDSDYYSNNSPDDVQAQAAETVNTSPAAALPIPAGPSGLSDDLERNVIMQPTPSRPRRLVMQAGSWRSLLSSSLGSGRRSPRDRDREEDRDR